MMNGGRASDWNTQLPSQRLQLETTMAVYSAQDGNRLPNASKARVNRP
jgi:hypothetical protein